MAATFSRVVEVRRWLVGALVDLPAFADALVEYSWREREGAPRTRVFTHRATFSHAPAGMRSGRTFRNEDASFDVVILHASPDQEPEDVADEAMHYASLVEDLLAENRVPPVDGVNWIGVRGECSASELVTDQGAVVEVVLRVGFDARLQ
jgi:hypothetical protein